MSIDVKLNEFDCLGDMSLTSKANFWKEINRAVQKFDEDKITLKPRKNQNAVPAAKNNSSFIRSVIAVPNEPKKEEPRRLLPAPPLRKRHRSVSPWKKSRARSVEYHHNRHDGHLRSKHHHHSKWQDDKNWHIHRHTGFHTSKYYR